MTRKNTLRRDAIGSVKRTFPVFLHPIKIREFAESKGLDVQYNSGRIDYAGWEYFRTIDGSWQRDDR